MIKKFAKQKIDNEEIEKETAEKLDEIKNLTQNEKIVSFDEIGARKKNASGGNSFLLKIPADKKRAYKELADENGITLTAFTKLSLAYVYNQIKSNKLVITDYGLEKKSKF